MRETTKDIQAAITGLTNGMIVRVTSDDLDRVKVVRVTQDTVTIMVGRGPRASQKELPISSDMFFDIYEKL